MSCRKQYLQHTTARYYHPPEHEQRQHGAAPVAQVPRILEVRVVPDTCHTCCSVAAHTDSAPAVDCCSSQAHACEVRVSPAVQALCSKAMSAVTARGGGPAGLTSRSPGAVLLPPLNPSAAPPCLLQRRCGGPAAGHCRIWRNCCRRLYFIGTVVSRMLPHVSPLMVQSDALCTAA